MPFNLLLLLLSYGASFDFNISLGNIINAVAFIVAAIVAWVKNNDRIKNVEEWIEEEKRANDSYFKELVGLKVVMAQLTEAIKGQTSRLDRVEDKVNGVRDTVAEQRQRKRKEDGE